MLSTHKLDLFNINGAPLCHAFGCRKHKKLIKYRNGLFCLKHTQQLDQIRSCLSYYKSLEHKTSEEIQGEIYFRDMELMFRKIMCPKHMRYILRLANEKCSVEPLANEK